MDPPSPAIVWCFACAALMHDTKYPLDSNQAVFGIYGDPLCSDRIYLI